MSAPPQHGTTPARRALGGNHTARNHACTTSAGLASPTAPNHAQHDERSAESHPARNHAQHDGRSAPHAFAPHLHNERSARRAFIPRRHNAQSAQRACEPHPAPRAPACRSLVARAFKNRDRLTVHRSADHAAPAAQRPGSSPARTRQDKAEPAHQTFWRGLVG